MAKVIEVKIAAKRMCFHNNYIKAIPNFGYFKK